ncbi:MAG: ATP-dependent zinc metalloprotease FtsH [Bacteroidales bacterium]
MSDEKNTKQQNNPMENNQPNTPKPKFNVYWVYALIAIAFIALQYFQFGKHPHEIFMKDLREMIAAKDIDKIEVINKEVARVYLKPGRLDNYQKLVGKEFNRIPKDGPHFELQIGDVTAFKDEIDKVQKDFPPADYVNIVYKVEKNYFLDIFISFILPIIILIAIWSYFYRRMTSGGGAGPGGANIFNVGKSRAKIFDRETSVKVNFSDVAGLEEAKIELKEIVDFLKNPKKYTDLGGKIPRGALLVGPPGTGKTLLAKAVAGEANVPFFSLSGSDFVEMFVGVGASRVRDLFAQAKQKAPCIVFIDEIDAVGRSRSKNPGWAANDERENTLNQLLTEMDGFAPNTGIIVLAATNRADILDRALLRAGRFDRQIHVELPDLKERLEIFKVHMRPLKLANDIDVEFLAKQTPGFSGADIANVCNEAALIAARKNKTSVEKQDFLDAIDRIIGGLEKRNKIISKLEKKTIAYHEAGHATVSWLLEHANPLVKVTIIPRGRALGAAWYLPEERQITTTEQLYDEMCATLGGRAAEEVVFGKVSTGALNDLERVTKQAYAMVAYFGMSDKIGNISYYDSTGQTEFTFSKPYSEKTAELIDEEAKKIVETQYERAKKILLENKEGLDRLAQKLLEKEVIFSEDLEQIFGKRKGGVPEEQQLLIENGSSPAATQQPENLGEN